MSKLVNISVNLSKIPQDKTIKGRNSGDQYVSLDIWINDEADQYGKDCSVNISQSKEERERKDRKVYCGNGKTLFGFSKPQQQAAPPQGASSGGGAGFDDIPFNSISRYAI